MEIRPLRLGDDRGGFHSGDLDLDRFLVQFAAQNQFRHHVGTTYVALTGGRILGYATVAPGQVEIDRLPATARGRLPRYPLPVLRLARLAVDQGTHGRGLGAALLRFVLGLALRLRDEFGCVGVLVDAKPGAAGCYARYGFFPLEVLEGAAGRRPSPVAMFLPIGAVAGPDARR